MVHAVAGRILGRPHRTRCARDHHRVPSQPLHAGWTGRSAHRRDHRRAAHAAGAQRHTDPSARRSTRSRIRGCTGAIANVAEAGLGTFQVGQLALRSASASATTACGRPVSCNKTTRASSAMSEAAALGGSGSHRVPPEAHRRRTSHRRIEGGARRIRLGDASVAEPEGRGRGLNAGEGTRRVRDVALRHVTGRASVTSPSSPARARSPWTSTRSPWILVSS